MSSSSAQLQGPYERWTLRLELWLLRREILQEIRRGAEASGAATNYRLSVRLLAKPFFVSLRVLGALLLAVWFITAMYDVGPVMARPIFLLTGAWLSWWSVGMLED